MHAPARLARLLSGTALLAGLAATAHAQTVPPEQPCLSPAKLMSISGKIHSNSLNAGETLGTMSANIDGGTKLKCAMQGKAFMAGMTLAGFQHVAVCDDEAVSENGIDRVHSQVAALTLFDGVPNLSSCGIPGMDLQYGSFREVSYPQSGRGIFAPGGGGRIVIEGEVNCAGAVEMKYAGHVCVIPD